MKADTKMSRFARVLWRALANRVLVRVERAQLEEGHMDGRVVALGEGLVVLALISDDVVPNGFVVLRVADLTSVRAPAPYAAFVEKVLAIRGGEQRLLLPAEPLSWGRILESARKVWPLIAVHAEVSHPDTVFIGQLARIPVGAAISLRLVGPDGKWRKKQKTISMADISRIDFGGRYEEALAIALRLGPRGKPARKAIRGARS